MNQCRWYAEGPIPPEEIEKYIDKPLSSLKRYEVHDPDLMIYAVSVIESINNEWKREKQEQEKMGTYAPETIPDVQGDSNETNNTG